MRIADVLRNKGASVATDHPGDLGVRAAHRACPRATSARWWWSSPDGLVGIVSERDVVRKLHELGAEILRSAGVGDHDHEVATCTPTDTVDSLSALMTTNRVRHVPVIGQRAGSPASSASATW